MGSVSDRKNYICGKYMYKNISSKTVPYGTVKVLVVYNNILYTM